MTPTPDAKTIRKWQQYLANERAEAAVYRQLAHKRSGEEKEILLSLARAEERHEKYWREKLGDDVGLPRRPDFSTLVLAFMTQHFGSLFALALMQNAEMRSPYEKDADATAQMHADEMMHGEVIRGLAADAREKMSGSFRAAIFGANDGLVSNLALVLGVMGSGVDSRFVLLAGISGLLSGALSMAAGEYISVKSSQELREASAPDQKAQRSVAALDVDANELALVYRARGLGDHEAQLKAEQVLNSLADSHDQALIEEFGENSDIDSKEAIHAAIYSFCCFAGGAFIPLIPFILAFQFSGLVLGLAGIVLVGIALIATGSLTGVLSGKPPVYRAIRQLLIGLGAAGITYVLGMAFGTIIG
ncbi:VIT1/CCC1 family protein [Corynebacterium sp. ES2794-CONJ1]|uniref:VIT1/CCC1 transporter family protein n=1 Tax=Corynebacterium sp. ES2794-CONJ1 TaxID=2980553 RepID=UPI0021DAAAF5|nr:VIT1/CCC1 family protein [Corynebacterium sp. ES2794-CONJ1]MCU9519836.1 VIT1/CCC1 family protein [Corynebacterium sp. ES2794-CONJ1]